MTKTFEELEEKVQRVAERLNGWLNREIALETRVRALESATPVQRPPGQFIEGRWTAESRGVIFSTHATPQWPVTYEAACQVVANLHEQLRAKDDEIMKLEGKNQEQWREIIRLKRTADE